MPAKWNCHNVLNCHNAAKSNCHNAAKSNGHNVVKS